MASKRRLSSGATLRPPLHQSCNDSLVSQYIELSDNNLNVEISKNSISEQDSSSNDVRHEEIEVQTLSTDCKALEDGEEDEKGGEPEEVFCCKCAECISNADTPQRLKCSPKSAYIRSKAIPSTEENSTPVPDGPNSNTNSFLFEIIIVILLCLPYLAQVVQQFVNPERQFDLQSIKKSFPTQNDDLWLAFESGVEDVIKMNRPSTFILLYKEEAEETLLHLLDRLSHYAICNIRDCSKEPIEITGAELNSASVIRDYGSLIEKYRGKLEDRGVMITRSLENVRGTSAQAFHVFCDEFTPLVKQSLFIFTMKVEGHSVNAYKFVEEYFKTEWTDIKIDTLNALITRITSMVIQVQA